MLLKKVIVSGVILASSIVANAGGAIDFSLADDSIRIEHDAVLVGTGAHFTTGYLYNEANSSWGLTAGFNAVDASMANQDLIGGVGFKAILISSEVDDFALATGVGGFIRYQPYVLNGLGIEGDAYVAPSILSFGELNYVHELLARVTYQVLPQARIFVGYYDVRGNYNARNNVEIDSTFHVGFRMAY
ncbi:YfaZ family outer membrane protein [Reinekea thalattae]|uniref:YfaZ n=1 Tax=Reinekea thalattae TaxID=2593301 RepID=A0A5C8Z731_9GAMM|nr:YfaZ family outer membrane protein [Reinekea thalattae]TXR53447.1 hypothetical protein FME95_02430 [Reinekea thalattae]